MKYYPIEDPLSDIRLVPVDKRWTDVHVYIDGKLAGMLRVARHRVDTLMQNTFSGKRCVAEIEDGLLVYHGEYSKPRVIAEDGSLVRVKELEHREDMEE